MITRRQAIKTTALAGAAIATSPGAIAYSFSGSLPASSENEPFQLPPLPYAYDALEPHIDAETMHIHHDKHHAAYVANLNKAFGNRPIGNDPNPNNSLLTLESFLKKLDAQNESLRTAIRNNGGGHYNHSLFWQMMKPKGGGEPSGELAKAIEKNFGSFSTFKENFSKAALGQFGSGWAWLVLDGKALKIEPTPNQDSPISQRASGPLAGALQFQTPLLGLDVWEHAYYLKYQNKRADYIAAWWNVVNWDFVADRFAKSAA